MIDDRRWGDWEQWCLDFALNFWKGENQKEERKGGKYSWVE